MWIVAVALGVAQQVLAAAPVQTWTQQVAGNEYLIVRADLHGADVTLHWLRPDGTPWGDVAPLLADLGRNGRTAWMVSNAGMYGMDARPVGVHVENRKILHAFAPPRPGSGNFSWLPNGVLVIGNGRAAVVESSRYPAVATTARYASQSGPLLVHNGNLHPGFVPSSQHRNVRNGVGVDKTGRVVFAISQGPVTFYDFAQLFRKTLHCSNALYLDGSISAMATPEQTVRGPHPAALVGLWAVTTPRTRAK
jgi:uncharacterized protein YigE (DUF2233 family)